MQDVENPIVLYSDPWFIIDSTFNSVFLIEVPIPCATVDTKNLPIEKGCPSQAGKTITESFDKHVDKTMDDICDDHVDSDIVQKIPNRLD